MRRVAVGLVTLFLVNLPFVHQALTERSISRSGQDVEATLVKAQTIDERRFVNYRLPRQLDPDRTVYSARVDDATYTLARETRVLPVRVVPGEPSANRPLGEVRSRVFAVVALTADAVFAVLLVLLWRRWRRWSVHEVVGVGDGLVSLSAHGRTLTVTAPEGWLTRVQVGDRVSGALHLVADGDLLPGLPLSGLDHLSGSTYLVRGRVRDARTGRVVLDLEDGLRLVVKTGLHRIRADIRDSTEVRGTLCFTPTVARA